MRTKLITALLMAGTVVGCASNPPPPPPMAMAPPPPPPPPAMVGPVDGTYKGMADLAADAPATCAKMTRPMTATVKKNMFSMGLVRATIAPDGTVKSTTRSGQSVMGMANGSMLDLTSMRGKCSYHVVLNKA